MAAGRATGTVWTQVVSARFNEMVIETDFPDLATYERESEALMSDPAVLKLFRGSTRSLWKARATTSRRDCGDRGGLEVEQVLEPDRQARARPTWRTRAARRA